MQSSTEQKEVAAILEKEGISPAFFLSLLGDFNEALDGKGGLVAAWEPLNAQIYDSGEISTGWEKAHPGVQDKNCRLISFSLMKDLIKLEKPQNTEDYGSYVMMDIAAVEEDSSLGVLKPELGKYIALFDEIKLSPEEQQAVASCDSGSCSGGSCDTENSGDACSSEGCATCETGDLEAIYPKAWADRGIVFPKGNVSLISVVMNDPDSGVLFVGHTGVLVNEGKGYLYIEKLAPLAPYQALRLQSKEQLKSELLSRAEYYEREGAAAPFIYENDRILQ